MAFVKQLLPFYLVISVMVIIYFYYHLFIKKLYKVIHIQYIHFS